MRWIQYADTGDRAAAVDGRPRQGETLGTGAIPGTVWARPAEWECVSEPGSLGSCGCCPAELVLVHVYPNAPERNYALGAEQPVSPIAVPGLR